MIQDQQGQQSQMPDIFAQASRYYNQRQYNRGQSFSGAES